MNDLYFMIAQATSTAPGGDIFGNQATLPIMMVAFIAFFYFVLVRPQNKKKKEAENMMKNLKAGDKIISIGGCHGKVVKVSDDTVTVRIDDKAEVTFDKNAIARVIDPNAKPVAKVTDKNKKDKKDNTSEVAVEQVENSDEKKN